MKVNSEKKKVLKIYFCFYDAEGKYYRYFRYYSTRVKATSTVQGTFIATELLSKYHTFCYVYGLLEWEWGGGFSKCISRWFRLYGRHLARRCTGIYQDKCVHTSRNWISFHLSSKLDDVAYSDESNKVMYCKEIL